MGDYVCVQLPVQEIYLGLTSHPDQLILEKAGYHKNTWKKRSGERNVDSRFQVHAENGGHSTEQMG